MARKAACSAGGSALAGGVLAWARCFCGGFGLLEGLQGQLPGVFQFGRDMAMRRIDVAELAFTIGGLIAQPLEMLRVGFGDALGLLLPLGQRLFIDIELHGREGLEKRVDHTRIDGIGRNILTHGGPILLPEVVTDVAGAPLILHHHLVAAFPAVDEPVQQGFARTRDATGFVPVILGVIVFEHRLNLEIRLPTDIGRVDVRDADAPLLLGETGERGAHLDGSPPDGGGLPDVDDGLAGQMLGRNQIGVVHRSPPGRAP